MSNKDRGPGKLITGKTKEHWKSEPESHDYPAAANYLTLLLRPELATSMSELLKEATTLRFKAKDLLRASRLPLLPEDNDHVAEDLKKVSDGELLSPVLLVRGALDRGRPLTVADGYHRICASYHLDENADIPCRVVELTI